MTGRDGLSAWFELAGSELSRHEPIPELWARALVEGGGEELRVHAAYVRLRVASLQEQQQTEQQTPTRPDGQLLGGGAAKAESPANAVAGEIAFDRHAVEKAARSAPEVKAAHRVSFIDAIELGWRRALDFRGRATRAEYWWWLLFHWIVVGAWLLLLWAVLYPIGFGDSQMEEELSADVATAAGVISLIFYALWHIPLFAVGFRRLHDIGVSGWVLIGLPLFQIVGGGVVGIATVPGSTDQAGALSAIQVLSIFYGIGLTAALCLPSARSS